MKTSSPLKKIRMDQYLVEKKLVTTREKARRLIMAGSVFVEGNRIDKPGTLVTGMGIEIREKKDPYVSRGGIKLEHGLNSFNLFAEGKSALDAGASTGGFTDCLLQHGAVKVYAVDVGYGQLDWRLQTDPRVVRKERVNVRYLTLDEIGEKVDLITLDLSFISLTLVLRNLIPLLKPEGEMIALVKPQFEVGRKEVGKGGIVRGRELHEKAVEKIRAFGEEIGLHTGGIVESPILGQKGNREFLIHFRKDV